jgi:hypothetical protein
LRNIYQVLERWWRGIIEHLEKTKLPDFAIIVTRPLHLGSPQASGDLVLWLPLSDVRGVREISSLKLGSRAAAGVVRVVAGDRLVYGTNLGWVMGGYYDFHSNPKAQCLSPPNHRSTT